MKIIIGLGNPGKQYENTYHNVGFMAIDAFVGKIGAKFNFKPKLKADVAEAFIGAQKVIFVKPQTFMNLSGEAVGAVVNFYKADLKDIVVVYDDLDLAVGAVRLRANGSAGTHNGMKNIILHIGTDFPRFRIGTKNTNAFIPTIDYVLSAVSKENQQGITEALNTCSAFLSDFISGLKMDALMNRYNSRK